MTVSILANHRKVPPFGLMGGEDGQVGANYVQLLDGSVHTLGHRGSVDIKAGETFVIETPGGGGYGEVA